MTSNETYEIISQLKGNLKQKTETEPGLSALYAKIEILDELARRLRLADKREREKMKQQAHSIEAQVRQ